MRLLKSKGRHNNVNLDALEPKEDHTSHAQRKQESSNKKQEKKDLDPNSKQKPSNTKKEQDSIDDTSSKKVKQSKQKQLDQHSKQNSNNASLVLDSVLSTKSSIHPRHLPHLPGFKTTPFSLTNTTRAFANKPHNGLSTRYPSLLTKS